MLQHIRVTYRAVGDDFREEMELEFILKYMLSRRKESIALFIPGVKWH